MEAWKATGPPVALALNSLWLEVIMARVALRLRCSHISSNLIAQGEPWDPILSGKPPLFLLKMGKGALASRLPDFQCACSYNFGNFWVALASGMLPVIAELLAIGCSSILWRF